MEEEEKVKISKWQKYRLKDLEAYREKKREYAKTPEQREKRNAYMRLWKEKNREKHNESARRSHAKHRHKHAEKLKRNRLLKVYGIIEEHYQELLANQNNSCKICGKDNDLVSRKRMHVDHDHNTNVIRGLLCSRCNGALGWYEKFKDNILDYLKDNLQIQMP